MRINWKTFDEELDGIVCLYCTLRNEEICEGETYYEIEGVPYCENCLREAATAYLMEHAEECTLGVNLPGARCECCEEPILPTEKCYKVKGHWYHWVCLSEDAVELANDVIMPCEAETGESFWCEYEEDR